MEGKVRNGKLVLKLIIAAVLAIIFVAVVLTIISGYEIKSIYDDMVKEEFLYEKKHQLAQAQKEMWLEKFFSRMNSALYKWYITAPAPIIDAYSINKAEFKHPITSKINYKEKKS